MQEGAHARSRTAPPKKNHWDHLRLNISASFLCPRIWDPAPHQQAGDERPHLLQFLYPAVHGDTSLGVSNVVAKTRWLGIGYGVQRESTCYCVAGGTSLSPRSRVSVHFTGRSEDVRRNPTVGRHVKDVDRFSMESGVEVYRYRTTYRQQRAGSECFTGCLVRLQVPRRKG